jgi:hypothetical protein
LISLLAFVYLTQASHVARQIEQMENLERDLQQLKQQNDDIRLQIADNEQLPRIKEQAQKMGLAQPEQMQYLEVVSDEPVSASQQAVPVRASQPAAGGDKSAHGSASPAAETASSSGWGHALLSQFSAWVGVGALSGDRR